MNPRHTWLWVALAGGLFAFIFLFERHWERPEAGPPRVLPGLKAAAVTSVQVRPAGALEIRADRTNGVWELTRPLRYPGQAASIENLLAALEQLRAATTISAGEVRQHPNATAEYGFDTPQVSLLLQPGDHRLLVGARTPPGDQVYLQVVGVEGVFVVSAELLNLIPRGVNGWRDTTWVSLKNLTFDRVVVTSAERVFEVQRDAAGQQWLLRPLQVRADPAKIESALQELQQLRVTQFVSDQPGADLESYGLQPPELALTLTQGTNAILELQFGRSPTNHPRLVFARRGGTAAIVTVAREPLAPWRVKSEDLRDRHLVTLPRAADLLEVRGAETFTVQRQGSNTWRVLPQDWPADTALVEEVQGMLAHWQVSQFVKDVVASPELVNYGLATPTRQVVLKAGAPSGGGATNLVLCELDFGSTREDKTFVRRRDEDFVYAVKTAEMERLPTAAFQLRERRIWSFSGNDVARLTIQQRGKVRQLLRQGTNSWSFALGSQGIINDFAVEEAVHRLGGLAAVVWVARLPAATSAAAPGREPALANYGFTTNSLSLTLELKTGDKLSVAFGGPAPSQLTYAHTTMADEIWVFESPPAISEMVRTYLTIPADVP